MWRIRYGSKFGAKRQEYNGIKYHSKGEAGLARDLDFRVRAGELKSWRRQVPISLDVNGMHICNYICDFELTYPDGTIEYLEYKGFETPVFRLKRKLLEALYPNLKYVVQR